MIIYVYVMCIQICYPISIFMLGSIENCLQITSHQEITSHQANQLYYSALLRIQRAQGKSKAKPVPHTRNSRACPFLPSPNPKLNILEPGFDPLVHAIKCFWKFSSVSKAPTNARCFDVLRSLGCSHRPAATGRELFVKGSP